MSKHNTRIRCMFPCILLSSTNNLLWAGVSCCIIVYLMKLLWSAVAPSSHIMKNANSCSIWSSTLLQRVSYHEYTYTIWFACFPNKGEKQVNIYVLTWYTLLQYQMDEPTLTQVDTLWIVWWKPDLDVSASLSFRFRDRSISSKLDSFKMVISLEITSYLVCVNEREDTVHFSFTMQHIKLVRTFPSALPCVLCGHPYCRLFVCRGLCALCLLQCGNFIL